MSRFLNFAIPPGSVQRHVAKKIRNRFKSNLSKNQSISYDKWIKANEKKLWVDTKDLRHKPLISIITPTFNTPDRYFKALVQSLLDQTYGIWELCVADGSTNIEREATIQKICQSDKRIIYKKLSSNQGIVGNTNEGLKMARGNYVGFLDHDDTLSPHALMEIVVAINEDSDVDLIYCDEDKLSDDGRRRLSPFFKPDWSPELLMGVNYITHFTVARKSLVDKIGGLRKGFDGAQDYDFLLRITEYSKKIKHIPKILYHWRLAHGSTAKDVGEKNYADTAGRRALADAVKRRKIKAEVLGIPERPTNYRLRYTLPAKQPLVSVIIPFKDKADLLKQCVDSIVNKTTYKNYEIILISNNSVKNKTDEYLATLKDKKIKVFYWDKPFNYAAINNYGRSKAKGDYLILLNNDTEVITPDWMNELIGVACQSEVGAVGPLLYYPNQTIQHAGVILGLGGMAGHVFRKLKPNDWTDYGMPAWPRNYLAVTGACLVIDAKKYDRVGGLDEKFVIAGNDVALGIKLYESGYRNVFWPFAQLIHHENQSVGSYQNVPESDFNHSLTYYKPYLDWKDPYFNINLDLMNEQIGIRSNYEK